ncbi:hypothetical protein D9M69_606360 [compost metagenome]
MPGCALLEAGALGLKGKTTRTRLFAVAGDEDVAASPDFGELQHLHSRLVQNLRVRTSASRSLANAAKLKGATITPGLVKFYGRITRRSDHFTEVPADQASRIAE